MSALTIDQTKVLEAIRYFCDKFEKAFPSVPKIAAMAGMCTRKCSDRIRELVELGRLIKIKRWNQSNMYQIVDPEPVKEEPAAAPKTDDADYKRSYKSSKKSFIKTSDDEYKVEHQNQLDFVRLAKEMGISPQVIRKLYPHVRNDLINCNYWAFRAALSQFVKFHHTVSSIGPWFKSVLEDWRVRV